MKARPVHTCRRRLHFKRLQSALRTTGHCPSWWTKGLPNSPAIPGSSAAISKQDEPKTPWWSLSASRHLWAGYHGQIQARPVCFLDEARREGDEGHIEPLTLIGSDSHVGASRGNREDLPKASNPAKESLPQDSQAWRVSCHLQKPGVTP